MLGDGGKKKKKRKICGSTMNPDFTYKKYQNIRGAFILQTSHPDK